uniref:(northern house mosquito) hypothetical protein n=1 Tax=Culex pipiens TaxID=7175 RepID=A0A8D8A2Q6_CULPI
MAKGHWLLVPGVGPEVIRRSRLVLASQVWGHRAFPAYGQIGPRDELTGDKAGSFRTHSGCPFIAAEGGNHRRMPVAQKEDGGSEAEDIMGTGAATARSRAKK